MMKDSKNCAVVNFGKIIVPENQYFMMGDNRDGSDDSRFWGFVKDIDIQGRAIAIWMSWDSKDYRIRWNRIGYIP